MAKKQRLDKFLANQGIGSRSEVKKYITKKFIEVNLNIIKDPSFKVDIEVDKVTYKGKDVQYEEYVYLLIHKPAGVITATEDNYQETVLDLIEHGKKKDLFPVGRLDKDTEGLLILTNDGQTTHRLLSPKHHVDKTYLAHVNGTIPMESIELFNKGVTLDDDYVCKPADLYIDDNNEILSKVRITIREGKFHQIKRMFQAIDREVLYLKRLQMGPIYLGELEKGEYRALTNEEINQLKQV